MGRDSGGNEALRLTRMTMVGAGASPGKGGLLCLRWRLSPRLAFWLCLLMSLGGVSSCELFVSRWWTYRMAF